MNRTSATAGQKLVEPLVRHYSGWFLLIICLLTFLVYTRVAEHTFLAYDDGFFVTELWIFRPLAQTRSHWRARLARLAKFNLICVIGMGLSVLILHVEVNGLGMELYTANFVAIVLVSISNFGLNVRFGWRCDKNPASNWFGSAKAPQTS